jgi:hypothetical protein
MTASIGTSTRPFVSPTIVDFGSIAEHTFGNGNNVFPGFSGGGSGCNSGRGNGPESATGDSSTYINPREGGRGPGSSPSGDCDPGNSGGKNAGGD